MAKRRIILGAMSGTSADGVDVAAVEMHGRGEGMRARLLGLQTRPFQPSLRQHIQRLRSDGKCTLRELAELGREVTVSYACASNALMGQLALSPGDVACIAAHGQTLFHAPPLTIQWFDPALLAAQTDCLVISDFRRADCALGGQGAPLVPFADYVLFRDRRLGRVVLNIGGIANITYLPAKSGLGSVVAFDTGPGNCLSDHLSQGELGKSFDAGGSMASKGEADEHVVSRYLAGAYFRKPYPKSTDGPEMVQAFAAACGSKRRSLNDRLATACLCCARAIALGIRALPGKVDEIIAAGGGMRNRTIARMLAEEIGLPIRMTDELGVPIAAREAMAFAILAAATLDGVPSSVPSVTGAKRAAILGSITQPP